MELPKEHLYGDYSSRSKYLLQSFLCNLEADLPDDPHVALVIVGCGVDFVEEHEARGDEEGRHLGGPPSQLVGVDRRIRIRLRPRGRALLAARASTL